MSGNKMAMASTNWLKLLMAHGNTTFFTNMLLRYQVLKKVY